MLEIHLILLYFISFLTGICCITILLILGNRNKSELMKKMKDFNIALFVFVLIIFMEYYKSFFFHKWEMNALLMILYNFGLVVFFVYWFRLVQEILESPCINIWFRVIIAESIPFLAVWSIVYLFFMDREYYLPSSAARTFAAVTDTVFYATLILFGFYCIFAIVKNVREKLKRNYLIAINIMIIIFNCWSYFNDLSLICPFGAQLYGMIYAYNPIILIYFVVNVWTIIYLYKNNALSEVQAGQTASGVPDIGEGRYTIDEISERYHLTKREKELAQLVYKGCSNPEISEILNISTGTVKRHIQNIYKKMEIKNRYELIYLMKK